MIRLGILRFLRGKSDEVSVQDYRARAQSVLAKPEQKVRPSSDLFCLLHCADVNKVCVYIRTYVLLLCVVQPVALSRLALSALLQLDLSHVRQVLVSDCLVFCDCELDTFGKEKITTNRAQRVRLLAAEYIYSKHFYTADRNTAGKDLCSR